MRSITNAAKYLDELDTKYPNRHTTIHKCCCKHCPADNNRKNGVVDIESKDIKESVSKQAIAKEYLFVCAWRPNKLCKGLCDFM